MKNTYIAEHQIDVEYEAWDIGHSLQWKTRDAAIADAISKLSESYPVSTWLHNAMNEHPEWFHDDVAEEEVYRFENEPKVREMFHKYFEGKTWEEIRNDKFLYEMWDSYSDYHKDVFGYRPHAIVCGVYVRPY